jgi:hypothetical protein
MTYLNDHHAGSLGALEMIDHLIEIFKRKPLGQFFKQLRSEIETDKQTLEKPGSVVSGAAWSQRRIPRLTFC